MSFVVMPRYNTTLGIFLINAMNSNQELLTPITNQQKKEDNTTVHNSKQSNPISYNYKPILAFSLPLLLWVRIFSIWQNKWSMQFG